MMIKAFPALGERSTLPSRDMPIASVAVETAYRYFKNALDGRRPPIARNFTCPGLPLVPKSLVKVLNMWHCPMIKREPVQAFGPGYIEP